MEYITTERTKYIKIPRNTIAEIIETYDKLESLIATLEIVADRDAMKGIREGLSDVKKGNVVRWNIDEIDKLLG